MPAQLFLLPFNSNFLHLSQEVKCLDPIYVTIIVIITALVAAAIGYFIRKTSAERKIGSAEEAAKAILSEAEKQAQAIKEKNH